MLRGNIRKRAAMKTLDNETYFLLVRQMLAQGKTVLLRVRGESMTPFFPQGCEIRLRPAGEKDLRRGTPVLAQTREGMYVFHRIVRVCPEKIVLQGDGNLHGCEETTSEQVFGAVDCDGRARCKALLWIWARPLRRYLLGIWRRASRWRKGRAEGDAPP